MTQQASASAVAAVAAAMAALAAKAAQEPRQEVSPDPVGKQAMVLVQGSIASIKIRSATMPAALMDQLKERFPDAALDCSKPNIHGVVMVMVRDTHPDHDAFVAAVAEILTGLGLEVIKQ